MVDPAALRRVYALIAREPVDAQPLLALLVAKRFGAESMLQCPTCSRRRTADRMRKSAEFPRKPPPEIPPPIPTEHSAEFPRPTPALDSDSFDPASRNGNLGENQESQRLTGCVPGTRLPLSQWEQIQKTV